MPRNGFGWIPPLKSGMEYKFENNHIKIRYQGAEFDLSPTAIISVQRIIRLYLFTVKGADIKLT